MDSSSNGGMNQGQPARLPHIRLDPVADRDLIEWLGELEKEPQGVRGHLYKEMLRLGLRTAGRLTAPDDSPAPSPLPASASQPPLDTEVLLSDIRRVVEAVLETTLSRGGGFEARTSIEHDSATGDVLGSMIDDFMLGD